MTKARIDRAIKHLGLEIIRGEGYQYFVDLETDAQVGDSVYVCYLNHQTLSQWVHDAEVARQQEGDRNDCKLQVGDHY